MLIRYYQNSIFLAECLLVFFVINIFSLLYFFFVEHCRSVHPFIWATGDKITEDVHNEQFSGVTDTGSQSTSTAYPTQGQLLSTRQWWGRCPISITLYFFLGLFFILFSHFSSFMVVWGLGFQGWGTGLGYWGFQLIRFGACSVGLLLPSAFEEYCL